MPPGTGEQHDGACRPPAWLEGASEDPSLGYTRDDFAEHVRAEFSTFRWLLEPMLAATGFDIVTADFAGQVYGTYTCLRA